MSFKAYRNQISSDLKTTIKEWKRAIINFFNPTEYRVWWQSDGGLTVLENNATIYAFTDKGARKRARKLARDDSYILTEIRPL